MGKTYTLQIEVIGKDRASKPLGSVTSALGRMKEIAGGIIAAKLISGIATQIYNLGKESIMAAARVEELEVVMGVIAKANDIALEGMEDAVSTLMDYGIAHAESQQAVIQFARYQIDLAEATDIARVAQDAAVISQTDSSEALSRIMHGITTQNSLVLRNAGLNIMASDAMDKFATSLGITTEELTSQQRIQAMVNAVKEEGVKIEGAYVAAMDTAGKKLRSYKRYWNELAIAIGTNLQDAFHDVVFAGADVFKILQMLIKDGGVLETIFGNLGTINPFAGLLETTGKIKDLLEHFQTFSAHEFGVSGLDAFRNSIEAVFGEETASKLDDVVAIFGNIGWAIEQAKTKFFELKEAAMPSILWIKAFVPLAFELIKQKAEIALNWLRDNFPPVLNWLKENWQALALGIGVFLTVLLGVPAVISAVIAVIGVLARVVAFLTSPLTLVAAGIALLAVAWTQNWGDIQGKTASAIDWVKNVIVSGLGFIQSFWKKHGAMLTAVATSMWENLKAIFVAWGAVVQTIIAMFLDAWHGDWFAFGQKLRQLIKDLGHAISVTVNAWWHTLKLALMNLWTNIKAFFANLDAKTLGLNIMKGIVGGLLAGVRGSISAAKALMDIFRGFFNIQSPARLPALRVGIGGNIGKGIMIGAQDAINKTKLSFPKASPAQMLAPAGSVRGRSAQMSGRPIMINVNGADDPDRVADAIMRKLKAQGLAMQ